MIWPRWPWQSVQVADVIERRRVGEAMLHEREVADLRQALAEERQRFAELLALHLTPPTPTVTTMSGVVELAPRQKDPIAEKIHAESGGDPRIAAHFRKLASDLRKDGKSTEEILEAIGWTTKEPEVACGPSRATRSR